MHNNDLPCIASWHEARVLFPALLPPFLPALFPVLSFPVFTQHAWLPAQWLAGSSSFSHSARYQCSARASLPHCIAPPVKPSASVHLSGHTLMSAPPSYRTLLSVWSLLPPPSFSHSLPPPFSLLPPPPLRPSRWPVQVVRSTSQGSTLGLEATWRACCRKSNG